MPVYSDGVGNHYLGDLGLTTGTNADFLPSGGITNAEGLAADLASICTNAGLLYRDIAGFTYPSTDRIIYFGAAGDIDDRYAFNGWNTSTNTSHSLNTLLFNDSGAPGTALNSTNLLQYIGNRKLSSMGDYIGQWVDASVESRWAGCASSTSLSLFGYNYVESAVNGVLNKLCWGFWYAGQLEDFTPNFTNTVIHRSIIMSSSMLNINNNSSANGIYTSSGALTLDNLLCVALYNNSARRSVLTSSPATGPFNFSSGTQTRKLWASDLRVIDATSGVDMGKVKNMLLADGFFIPGVPIRLSSTLMPDAGSNLYVPVGKFAGRTALAKFYSSTLPTL
jgi:hypothetical protein